MLKLYVSITSWIIRIVGIVTILVFLYGLYIFLANDTEAGLGVVLGCVVFAVLLGAVAVLFRLSEQLLEIKNILIMHTGVKVRDKPIDAGSHEENESDAYAKFKIENPNANELSRFQRSIWQFVLLAFIIVIIGALVIGLRS